MLKVLLVLLLLQCVPSTLGLDDSVVYMMANADPAYAVVFPWVVVILGVVLFFLLTRYELPLPYAACMFIAGTCMGLGAVSSVRQADDISNLDQLTISIVQWSNINSSVLLLVFLPGLIFRDAIEVNFNLFMVSLSQILILAFPMVLVGTGLTALVGYYIIPYGWPLSLAATLGAILASTGKKIWFTEHRVPACHFDWTLPFLITSVSLSTSCFALDPVAVSSVLKKAGAPPRLQMHLAGESLLNDGSAVVFFSIFSTQYLSQIGISDNAADFASGFATFFRMSLGGMAVGLAFAAGLLIILYELDRRLEPEYNVLQVVAALTVAYLSYYVSEQACVMSGVVACVVTGVTVRAFGRGLIIDNQMMNSYLALMEYLLNTLLFALGGVVWGKVIAQTTASIKWEDWMYLLLLYVLVMAIRFFQVALFYPVFSRIGLRSNFKEAIFLSYGGLRGAVGIALGLSLTRSVRQSTDDEDGLRATERLEFLAGGVTLLTLFINGTTSGYVLQWLGLAKPALSRKRALRLFNASAESFVQNEYLRIRLEKRFMRTNFRVVKAHVPFVMSEPILSVAEEGGVIKHQDDIDIEESCNARIASISDRASCPTEVLSEVRQILLELIKEAYCIELSNGELDEREDNGFTVDLLQQSVDFAMMDIQKEEIHDWDYTKNFQLMEDAKALILRKYGALRGDTQSNHCCSYAYQKERTEVLRALSFMEAHRLAEKKLLSYVDSLSLDVHSAFAQAVDMVLDESGKQVASAHEFLNEYPPKEIENITSHYVASILLHRLAVFVEKNATEGILTKKEANEYLERIDRNVQSVHTCDKEYPSDLVCEATTGASTRPSSAEIVHDVESGLGKEDEDQAEGTAK
jgi:NhaP-type Na+/H+ or K+/H+ antiporter